MARENLETNPITIKPETVSPMAKQSSWVPLPSCFLPEQVKVARSCLMLCDPMDYTVHGILQARILWVAFPYSRGSSKPRDQTQVSCIAGDSLPAEPPAKLRNIGWGSLSFLQQVFLTQELDWGFLNCRRFFTSELPGVVHGRPQNKPQ